MTDARSGAIALKSSEPSPDGSWRPFWDCALAGAVGILNGFAVFVLTWEEETSIPKFLLILLLVALFADAFEYIRDVIEGHEHDVSASKSVAGLFLIAIFELFIMALHAAFKASKGWLEIGTAALGPTLAKQSGPVANIITMALLWVVIGSALAAGLSLAVHDPRQNQQPSKLHGTSNKGFGAIIGLLAAAVGAPLVVFLYILVVRFIAEVSWMLSKPDEWSQNVCNLFKKIPSSAFPLKIVVGLTWQVGHRFHSAWGPILAMCAVTGVTIGLIALVKEKYRSNVFFRLAIAGPIVILGVPLIGTSIYDGLRNVVVLFLLVIVVWAIPGLLLGMAVPYLRKPSENRKTWALTAWTAACLLVLFRDLIPVQWILLFAGLLILTGWAFWSGTPLEDYWPLVALCVATIVLGITQVTLIANFLKIQDLSRVLISEPFARVSLPSKEYAKRVCNADLRGVGDLWAVHGGKERKTHEEWMPPFLPNPWKTRTNSSNADLLGGKERKTHEEWMAAVSAEQKKVEDLLTETRQIPERLQKQAAENKKLTDRLSQLKLKDISDVATVQSKTETLLAASQEQLQRIALAQQAVKRLNDEEPALPLLTLTPSQKWQFFWQSITSGESGTSANRGQRMPALTLPFQRPNVGRPWPAIIPEELGTLVPRQNISEANLQAMTRDLAQRQKEINDADAPLNSAYNLHSTLTSLQGKLAQRFELCLNGSLGFWIPVGLLAGWSRHVRTTSDVS